MKIFTFFFSCIIIVLLFASNAHAQLINGKPTIHVPSNRLSEARDLLMQNPDAARALNSGALQISPDLGKYSALDYLGGKPVPSRLDYPDPNNPKGYNSVSGQDNIKNKLEELNRELQDKNIPKQQSEVICIVPRPGQSAEFGPLTDDPVKYPIRGSVQDTEPLILESDVNFNLRKLGSETMEIQLQKAEQQVVESGTKKVIRPNKAQSEEFITSMKGNPDARGSYKIGGTDVPVGKYRANQKDQLTGITFDESCENPKQEGQAPDPGQANPGGANPGFGDLGNGGGGGGGNGGGGGGFGGGGGGGLGGLGGGAGGALGQLLPLLMQGLMGGGQGQQGQGQNPYGAGYGNQQQNCAAQAVAPVCGMDGKTYNNTCYLQQQGTVVRNTGVCTTVNPTTTPNVNSIVTLTHLSQSGIPATLLDNVRNLVTSVLSSILAGSVISETTVQ